MVHPVRSPLNCDGHVNKWTPYRLIVVACLVEFVSLLWPCEPVRHYMQRIFPLGRSSGAALRPYLRVFEDEAPGEVLSHDRHGDEEFRTGRCHASYRKNFGRISILRRLLIRCVAHKHGSLLTIIIVKFSPQLE
jgi:hypothetical protein